MRGKHGENSDGAIRAFIALDLPESVQSCLREAQESFKKKYTVKVTWSRPENIHLTLKFLGDIRRDLVGPVGHVMEEAARQCPPMKLWSQAIGFFPGVKRPTVLWAGISGQTQ